MLRVKHTFLPSIFNMNSAVFKLQHSWWSHRCQITHRFIFIYKQWFFYYHSFQNQV